MSCLGTCCPCYRRQVQSKACVRQLKEEVGSSFRTVTWPGLGSLSSRYWCSKQERKLQGKPRLPHTQSTDSGSRATPLRASLCQSFRKVTIPRVSLCQSFRKVTTRRVSLCQSFMKVTTPRVTVSQLDLASAI